MRLHINGGYFREHSDLLAILMLTATVCVLGSGIFYLGQRVHAPAPTTTIFTGPVPPL
jgi:hypothetical protein